MPRSAARSAPAWALLVLAGITLAGLVLRLAGMDESLYGDERYTHNIVTGNGPGGIWHEVYTTSITPPLHYYLAWISVQLPGDDTILIRLPSLVLGTAAIPLIFLFGRRVGGVPVGLAAAALLALDPFAIFFSTEARAYETQVFLILVATLSLLRATDGGRRVWWAVWAVASAAAMWTHYSSLFVLVALPVWALWARPASAATSSCGASRRSCCGSPGCRASSTRAAIPASTSSTPGRRRASASASATPSAWSSATRSSGCGLCPAGRPCCWWAASRCWASPRSWRGGGRAGAGRRGGPRSCSSSRSRWPRRWGPCSTASSGRRCTWRAT